MRISTEEALQKLKAENGEFLNLFRHGTLSVEIYKPDQIDKQKPHTRDEVYVITEGSGTFFLDGKMMPFTKGDFLFVAAGLEHRFEDFTEDFSTWVIFYGPEGGESGKVGKSGEQSESGKK